MNQNRPPKGTVWVVIEPGSKFALVYEITGDNGEAREMVGEIVSEGVTEGRTWRYQRYQPHQHGG